MPDTFPLEPRVGVRLEKRRGRGASRSTIVFDVFTDFERRATFFAPELFQFSLSVVSLSTSRWVDISFAP